MTKKRKLPRSIRLFIRQEKSRIRREFLDVKKRQQMIEELYSGHIARYTEPPARYKQFFKDKIKSEQKK